MGLQPAQALHGAGWGTLYGAAPYRLLLCVICRLVIIIQLNSAKWVLVTVLCLATVISCSGSLGPVSSIVKVNCPLAGFETA